MHSFFFLIKSCLDDAAKCKYCLLYFWTKRILSEAHLKKTLDWYCGITITTISPWLWSYYVMEKSWKNRVLSRSWKSFRLPTNFRDTSNLLDTSMVWNSLEVNFPTFWTLPWYGHSLEICWKYHGNLLEVEISMIFRRHDFSSDNACYKKRIAGFLWVGYLLFVASKKNLCLFSFISS